MIPVIIAALVKAGLTGLASAVLSKGQETIEDKLGIKLEDQVKTEDGLIKLKQLEFEHQEFLINAAASEDNRELEYFKQEIADKESARAREIETLKQATAQGTPWWAPSPLTILAFIIIGGGGYMFYNTADTDTKYAIISIVTMVVSYYFGTSKQSHDKDSTIASIAAKGVK